tara:strand:+ start:186 stop:362 length:177 start_codon:yes stop_codon:yes gene_type:complete
MKIDTRNQKCVYVEIGEYTYYIDDTTNEQIIDKWKTKDIDYDNDYLEEVETSKNIKIK